MKPITYSICEMFRPNNKNLMLTNEPWNEINVMLTLSDGHVYFATNLYTRYKCHPRLWSWVNTNICSEALIRSFFNALINKNDKRYGGNESAIQQ